ncbi:MAG: hypothetical protein AB9834_09580 [Lentimicrobium sp.]
MKKSDQADQRELPKSQRIKGESLFCIRHLPGRDNSPAPTEKEETYFIRNTWIENPSVIVEIFHPPKFTGYKV